MAARFQKIPLHEIQPFFALLFEKANAKVAALDLVKSVHLRPHLTENWTELAKFILMAQPDGHEMARCCSRVAMAGDTNHRLVRSTR